MPQFSTLISVFIADTYPKLLWCVTQRSEVRMLSYYLLLLKTLKVSVDIILISITIMINILT